MKRDSNIYNYGHAIYQESIAAGLVYPDVPVQDVIDRHDLSDSFLKIVYEMDSRTKLPTGDLMYLVSDKANPEVKSWVLDNLLMDVSSAKNLSAPDGLSDDDIIELSRHPDEDSQSYMNRINDYMKYHREIYERMASASAKSVESSSDVSASAE